jgi:transposase
MHDQTLASLLALEQDRALPAAVVVRAARPNRLLPRSAPRATLSLATKGMQHA